MNGSRKFWVSGGEPAQRQILGLVDDAHPLVAQLLDDAVVRDDLAERICETQNVMVGMQ